MNRPYGFCTFIQQNDIDFVGTGVLDGPFRLTYFRRKRREQAPALCYAPTPSAPLPKWEQRIPVVSVGFRVAKD